MIRLTFLFTLFVTLFLSCKTDKSEISSKNSVHFGEIIDTTGMIAFDTLLSRIAAKDSVEAKVYGKVSAVCKTKGCWMDLVSSTDSTSTLMSVQFKDYEFFVPKDIPGKEVVVKGKAFIETTSVEDLRHFAEDEGLSPQEIEKITEPKKELKFIASGVLIK